MPGLIGICSSTNHRRPETAELSLAESAMPLNASWLRHEANASSGQFLASCFARNAESGTNVATLGSKTLVFDGEVFGIAGPAQEHAAKLLEQFQERGVAAIEEVEGRFVVAVWCDDSKRLTLATDKFSCLPLYYCQLENGFAFSTSINALVSLLPQDDAMNFRGLVQFFTFGHLWNDDTFHESVKACWSATELSWSADADAPTIRAYWRPSTNGARLPRANALQKLTESFSRSVRSQTGTGEGLGVALSGGLDARTMLAMVDTEKVRPQCISLGMEGSLDQRSARRLAELAGCEFHSLILGQGFLESFSDHIEQMVRLTDGHYLDQCIVMPTFPLYTSLGIKSLFRGHVGELLHMHKAYNFSVDGSFAAIKTGAQLETWLLERLQSHLTEGVKEPLFAGISASEFEQLGRESLRIALERTEHFDQPIDRLSQLFLDQRTRRETAMSLVQFSSIVDPRVPYLDSEFINTIFATPSECRIGETIQTHMLRQSRPEFLKPANSNTGAPVGVSALRRTLSYYRMRVFAKLGLPGYQPYERLGLWLRRELAEYVQRILLDAECLDRGLFNPDCVKAVVRRHLNTEANHTFLLMAMMILELGQRRRSLAATEAAVS